MVFLLYQHQYFFFFCKGKKKLEKDKQFLNRLQSFKSSYNHMGTNITPRNAESTGLVNNQNCYVMSHIRTRIQSAENKYTGMHVHALFMSHKHWSRKPWITVLHGLHEDAIDTTSKAGDHVHYCLYKLTILLLKLYVILTLDQYHSFTDECCSENIMQSK